MKHHGGSLRLITAGLVAAGGTFVPVALAGAQANCATASPSDTSCVPPVTQPVVVEGAALNAAAAAPAAAVAAEPVSTDQLAFTGSDSAQLAAIGAGALALGAGSMVISRRRRRA